jgi:hypothetical protein
MSRPPNLQHFPFYTAKALCQRKYAAGFEHAPREAQIATQNYRDHFRQTTSSAAWRDCVADE